MSIVFSAEESALLDRIAIDMELDRLTPFDRALVEFRFASHLPDDYVGPWPAGKYATGDYVGRRYLGRPMSGTTTHERTTRILARWRRRYHPDGDAHPASVAQPATLTFTSSPATRPTMRLMPISTPATSRSRAA